MIPLLITPLQILIEVIVNLIKKQATVKSIQTHALLLVVQKMIK